MIKTIPFAIVGAGPAGLAAAIAYGKGAVIIEKNSEAGKKLLLSGTGQCNFTNTLSKEDFIRACRKAGPWLKSAIYTYDSDFFINLLDEAGCNSFAREDGKVFPVSLKAEHVRDAMLNTALHNGAEIYYKSQLSYIKSVKGGFILEIYNDKLSTMARIVCDEIFTPKLLLACGGSSWPQTGSMGDGHRFATSLGHTINPIRPALASIETTSQDSFSQCSGSTLQNIRADFITKTGRHKDTGDVLFTHIGLSGPLILNNSYLLKKGDTVRLHLVPDAEKSVPKALQDNQHKIVLNALKALPLTEAIIASVLHHLCIFADTPVRELSKKDINKIIGFLQAGDFIIKQVESLETSMSTAGGVLLKEVNPATMESRIVPNLFFAGEVLDYALPTGGFNIQAAFSTGYLCGVSSLTVSNN